MADIGILVAVVAGLVSFLSPCVLPIIPGFLAYLAGTSTNAEGGAKRFSIFTNAVFFVLGFSVVFALLGMLLSTLLASIAYDVQVWLSRISGVVVIFFGLYLTGLFRIGFFERGHKFRMPEVSFNRYSASFLFGSAFAAGWTPCVGVALGAILGLAASQPGIAFVLLIAYAIGLGIPFLAVGLFTQRAADLINRHSAKLRCVHMIFGAVLVILGVLIFTQELKLVGNFDLLNAVLKF